MTRTLHLLAVLAATGLVLSACTLSHQSSNPKALNTIQSEMPGHAENWKLVIPGQVWKSQEHDGLYSQAFMNDTAFGSFKTGGPYQTGSAFIVNVYDDPAATASAGHYFMLKMEDGYDPDYGDWYYGRLDGIGQLVTDGNSENSDVLDDCITCHQARAGVTDFIFEP